MAWSLPQVQIHAVSGSKESIVVNQGRLEGIHSGMQAFFLNPCIPYDF